MKVQFTSYLSMFIITVGLLFAQNNSQEPLKIINADVMDGTRTETSQFRVYRGNIKLQHGNMYANSDTAFQYFNSNTAELKGRVRITQLDMILESPFVRYNGNTGIATARKNVKIVDSNVTLTAIQGTYNTNNFIADFEGNVKIFDSEVTITADKGKYNRRTLNSEANGNVKVEDDSVEIFSDYLFYHRVTKESKNYGNVVLKGKYQDVYLTGDSLINVPKLSYSKVSGNPVLFSIDSTMEDNVVEYDTMSISSDLMESLIEDGNEKYLFTENVEIVKSQLHAKSNNAIFFKGNELFFMEGKPTIWLDSIQLHADSIIVYLPDNELKLIHAFGNALAVTIDDTTALDRKNQIIGKSIKIYFSDREIQKIESIGNAKSLYFMTSEDGYDGVNRSNSDTINIYFQDGKPLDVHWYGAVDGEYFPEKQVWNKIADYYLPNFRWSQDKPKKKVLKTKQ